MRFAGHLAMLLALGAPVMAAPPPPPPPHARYGPVTQCLGGYAVAVASSEAIYVMDDGISLMTPDYLINLSLEQPDPYREQRRSSEFDHPRFGRILRYQSGDGEGRRIENRLPPIEGERAVIVRSSVAEEQTALSRVTRADPRSVQCGNFIAPDFPGEHPDAHLWAPLMTPGPLFRCERRIGYALRAGEGMREPWPLWADNTPSRVVLPGARLVIYGPYRAPSGFVGPAAAGYRVTVQNRYDGHYLFLSPPRSFLRRQPRDERPDYVFRIEFPSGGETAAREFATRLEFVESGDPRCNANRE